jgi:hypothetical protein
MPSTVLMLRKDLYCSRIFLGNILILFILMWLGFSLLLGQMAVFYGVIIIYSILLGLFGSEENEQLSDINNLLPVALKTRIFARYLYSWFISLLFTILTGGLLLLGSVLRPGEVEIDIPAAAIQMLCSALAIIVITFPLIYRMGMQKAKIYSVIIYTILIMSSTLLPLGLMQLFDHRDVPLTQIMLGGLAVLVVLSPVSLMLSTKWARKK